MFKTYKRKNTTVQAIELTKDNLQRVVDFCNKEYQKYNFSIEEDKVVFYETQEKTTKYTLVAGDFIAVQNENDIYPIKAENFEKIYGPALEIPKDLPDHMCRVYMELLDLDKKIHDLGVYIANGQPKASPHEAQLQLSQFESMKKYSSILNERIKLYLKK